MRVRLVFDHWQHGLAGDISETPLGDALSTGDLHGGSTWEVDITGLPTAIQEDILDAWQRHKAYPVFSVQAGIRVKEDILDADARENCVSLISLCLDCLLSGGYKYATTLRQITAELGKMLDGAERKKAGW